MSYVVRDQRMFGAVSNSITDAPINRVEMIREFGSDRRAYQYGGYTFLPNIDSLTQRRSIEIYDSMMGEVQVENGINALRYAVVGMDFTIVPASDDPKDIEVADFVRWNLENLTGSVRLAFFEILSSIYRGYSVTEKIFQIVQSGRWRGNWMVSQFKAKNAKDYEFKVDQYLNITELLLTAVDGSGTPVPREKFIIHIHNPLDGQPHGRSVLRKVYKHWWSKDFLLKWWNIYCETFAMPTRVASFPAGVYLQDTTGAGSSQTRLQNILEDIMEATAITIPDDIKLEFIGATKGGWQAFENAIKYHDTQINIGIQGETLTVQSGTSGSFALGTVHQETKREYTTFIRASLEDSVMTEQVIKQLVDFNYSVENYPKFYMAARPKGIEDMTADELVKLASVGIFTPADKDIIRARVGLPPQVLVTAMNPQLVTPPTPTEPVLPPFPVVKNPANAGYVRSEFSLTRKLNKYENRTDFARLDKDMTIGEADFITALSPIVNNMKLKMISYLPTLFENGKLINAKWADLKLIGLNDFANTYSGIASEIIAQQIEIAYGEVDNGALAGAPSAKHAAATVKMENQRFPAAELANIAKWRANKNWAELRAWRDRKKLELKGVVGAQAFWITDIVKRDILGDVKDTIMAGVQNGSDIKNISKAVGGIFEKYIARGDVKNPDFEKAPRLEKIVRTNTNRLFNVARRQAFTEAGAGGPDSLFPGLMFSAIMDDRVSDICEELDGSIYLADDPIWDTITPPLHYNCRSTVVPVYVDDMPAELAEQPDTAKIDIEFGGTG